MLSLRGSSGHHHYREPRDRVKFIRRFVITVVVLVLLALIGWLGYHWYQSLNDQPPMSVTYVHHEPDKNAPALYEQMKLKLGKVTSPLAYGQTSTIAATSVKGAKCQINLYFRNGDKAIGDGMKNKVAGSDGSVSWTWKVEKSYPSGIWPFTIECRNPTGADKVEGKVTISDPNFNN